LLVAVAERPVQAMVEIKEMVAQVARTQRHIPRLEQKDKMEHIRETGLADQPERFQVVDLFTPKVRLAQT
jgi:hypothetical protein